MDSTQKEILLTKCSEGNCEMTIREMSNVIKNKHKEIMKEHGEKFADDYVNGDVTMLMYSSSRNSIAHETWKENNWICNRVNAFLNNGEIKDTEKVCHYKISNGLYIFNSLSENVLETRGKRVDSRFIFKKST
jgi:hypothetical protein